MMDAHIKSLYMECDPPLVAVNVDAGNPKARSLAGRFDEQADEQPVVGQEPGAKQLPSTEQGPGTQHPEQQPGAQQPSGGDQEPGAVQQPGGNQEPGAEQQPSSQPPLPSEEQPPLMAAPASGSLALQPSPPSTTPPRAQQVHIIL
jgi:collagen type III alpha